MLYYRRLHRMCDWQVIVRTRGRHHAAVIYTPCMHAYKQALLNIVIIGDLENLRRSCSGGRSTAVTPSLLTGVWASVEKEKSSPTPSLTVKSESSREETYLMISTRRTSTLQDIMAEGAEGAVHS